VTAWWEKGRQEADRRRAARPAVDAYLGGLGGDAPRSREEGPRPEDLGPNIALRPPGGTATPPTAAGKVEVFLKRDSGATVRDGHYSTAQQQRFDTIAANVRLLHTVAPRLAADPAVVTQLAMDPFLAERIGDVADAEAFLRLRSDAVQLEMMPVEHQDRVWEGLTRAQQAAYRQEGYRPPEERPDLQAAGMPGGSLVPGFVEDAWDFGFKGTIGAAMDAFLFAENVVGTAYRAGSALNQEQGGPTGGGGTGLGGFLGGVAKDPGHYLDLLGEAWDGGDFYQPGTRAQLEDRFADASPEQLALVISLSRGDGIEEIVDRYADMGDETYTEAWKAVHDFANDDLTRDALRFLAARKISPGRDLARGLGIRHDNPVHDLVSGLGDAFWLVATDPTLLAGKTIKAVRFQRYSLQAMARRGKSAGGNLLTEVAKRYRVGIDPDSSLATKVAGVRTERGLTADVFDPHYQRDLQRLGREVTSHQRLAVVVADHVAAANAGRPEALQRLAVAVPPSRRFTHAVLDYQRLGGKRITDADDFVEFMLHSGLVESLGRDVKVPLGGVEQLLRGAWPQHFADDAMLPRLSRSGIEKMRARLAVRSGVHRAARAGLGPDDFNPEDFLDAVQLRRATGGTPVRADTAQRTAAWQEWGESATRAEDWARPAPLGGATDEGPDFWSRTVGDTTYLAVPDDTGAMKAVARMTGRGDTMATDIAVRPGVDPADADTLLEGAVAWTGAKLEPRWTVPEAGLTGLTDPAAATFQAAMFAPVRALARGVIHMTSLIPSNGTLVFNHADTPEKLNQLLDFGVTGKLNDQLYGAFLLADNAATKRQVERSVLATIFHQLGIDTNPAYATFIDDWLYGARQRYGLNDALELANGQTTHVALWPRAQRADAMQIPDFLTIHRMARTESAVHWLTGWAHHRWTDRAMTYWKRSVVWRPAFIPRAGGEEMLSQMARWGPGHAVKQYLALPLAGKDPRTPLLGHKQARSMRRWMFSQLDEGEIAQATLAGAMAEEFARTLRRFAGMTVDEFDVRAYRQLFRNPDVMRDAAPVTGLRHAGVAGDVLNPEELIDERYIIKLREATRDGEMVDVTYRPAGTHFEVVDEASMFHRQYVDWTYQEISADPLGRLGARVLDLQLTPTQADNIARALGDTTDTALEVAIAARARLADLPASVRRPLLAWADTDDVDSLIEAKGWLREAVADGTVQNGPEVTWVVNALEDMGLNERRALLSRANDVFGDVDTAAGYFLHGDDLIFSGAVIDLGELDAVSSFDDLLDTGRVRPLGWSGPGFYATNYGPYSQNYARPLREPFVTANPSIYRFRTRDGQPLKILNLDSATDADRATLLEGMAALADDIAARVGANDAQRQLIDAILTEAVTAPNPFGRMGELLTEVYRPWARAQGIGADLVDDTYLRLYKRHVIDRMTARGFDGVYDHDTAAGVANMALWRPERLERLDRLNAVELEMRANVAAQTTRERAALVAKVQRGDAAAAEQLALDLLTARASAADYVDDLVSAEDFGAVATAPPANHTRLYVPVLSADDATALVDSALIEDMGRMEWTAGDVAAGQAAPTQSTAQQLLARQFDPEWRSFLFDYAEQIGGAGMLPGVRLSYSDPDSAQRLLQWLDTNSVDHIGAGRWRLGYVDVPNPEVGALRASAPQVAAAPDLGTWVEELEHFQDVMGGSTLRWAGQTAPDAAGAIDMTAHQAPVSATRNLGSPRRASAYLLPEHLAPKLTVIDPGGPVQRVAAAIDDGFRTDLRAIMDMAETGGHGGRFPLKPRTDDELLDAVAATFEPLRFQLYELNQVGIDPADFPRLLLLPAERRAGDAAHLAEEILGQTLDGGLGLDGFVAAKGRRLLSVIGDMTDDQAALLVSRMPVGYFAGFTVDVGHPLGMPERFADAIHLTQSPGGMAMTTWLAGTPLDPEDLADLAPWVRQLAEGGGDRLPGQLDLAVGERFEDVVRTRMRKRWQEINDVLRDPDGEIIHAAAGAIADGTYRAEVLAPGRDVGRLPAKIKGPALYRDTGETTTEMLTRRGFEPLARGVAALSRKPIVRKHYADNWRAADEMLGPLLRDDDLVTAARVYLGRDDVTKATDILLDLETTLRLDQVIGDVDGDALVAALRAGGVDVAGSDRAAGVIERWWRMESNVQAHLNELARTRAVQQSIPYIDDPAIRSQFASMIGNVIPFWFAEEQFYKRWVRTMAHSPEALRRLQLMHHGLKSVGWIDRNDFGEDVYVIPGGSYVNDALARAWDLFPADSQWTIPMDVAFTGSLKYSAPGFDRIGVPSPGPLFALPMRLLTRLMPELAQVEEMVTGSRAGRSYLDLVIPAPAMRTYRFATARDEDVAALTIGAMQYLEANHPEFVPGPDASSTEVEVYLERVRNHARIIGLTKAILGFVAPASPSPDLDPGDLNPAFRKLLAAGLPFEEAVGIFLADNPDATALTVLSTSVLSKAPARATDQAFQVMIDHGDYFERYREAGPWLLPQSEETEPFSRAAWYEMLALEIRVRKGDMDAYRDMKFAEAAPYYFDQQEVKDAKLAAARTPGERQAVREAWRTWRDDYFAVHRIFAEDLQSRAGHNRRMAVLDQIGAALEDPDRPPVAHAEDLGELLAGWRYFEHQLSQLADQRTARANTARRDLRVSFHEWATAFAKRHPTVAAFYQRILEPEIDLPVDYEEDVAA
jgi:hypothetical protein